MLLMTLLQLKYIVKIVECGSMNEASHELYVSQPALSSSVKELENELGIEIFTRSSQGIALTVDGAEFLTYARQVLDQADLLEERYKNAKPRKQLCSVSTQHYMFAVEAFVEMIDSIKSDEYEFTIRETRTKDIINQVANMLSEIGIIYLSDFNKDVIGKLLREKHLEFHPLFRAPLHVFISRMRGSMRSASSHPSTNAAYGSILEPRRLSVGGFHIRDKLCCLLLPVSDQGCRNDQKRFCAFV